METKYTKGPWTLLGTTNRNGWHLIGLSAGRNTDPVCMIDIGSERDKANIALISAAPDLLEACKEALSLIAQHDGCSRMNTKLYDVSDKLRSAIYKAEGR